jgi:hypothetical protein
MQNAYTFALKGIWETQPNAPGIKFEITGRKPHHFKLRILSQPSCKALPIDQYALTVGYAQPPSATDFRITRAQIQQRVETALTGSWASDSR